MVKILIVGAGKIGTLLTLLFAMSERYQVTVADLDFSGADFKRLGQFQDRFKSIVLDVSKSADLERFLSESPQDAVLSSLPFFCNVKVAEAARRCGIHYFDLTEDTEVTRKIKEIAKGAETAFVPQCGLAPGFVGIVANDLIQSFEQVKEVKLRVGALPQNSSNALQYAFTWSIDGLLNEYINPGYGIKDGENVILESMEYLRSIQLNGITYETFTTSGGLGSLAEIYRGKVQKMNYKSIRYPGHCEKMRFLLHDLKLRSDRSTLKRILVNVLPSTYQDMVLVYVSVVGKFNGHLHEKNYTAKYYPKKIGGLKWSAIQVTTAASAASIVDLILTKKNGKGFVYQETFALKEFLDTEFGQHLTPPTTF